MRCWNCVGAGGAQRQVPITDFYRLPGDTPHIETVLEPGEMITAVDGSRQRGGAQLALSEAARPRELRVRAGVRRGRRWKCATAPCATFASRRAASAPGHGGCRKSRRRCAASALDDAALHDASARAGEGARPATQNAFKQILLRRAVLRALQTASA